MRWGRTASTAWERTEDRRCGRRAEEVGARKEEIFPWAGYGSRGKAAGSCGGGEPGTIRGGQRRPIASRLDGKLVDFFFHIEPVSHLAVARGVIVSNT